MANPFEDKQDTTGGKAGFGAFNELTSDKAYDDETLTDNPGAPLPTPVANPPETFIKGRQVTRPDYEGIQLKKFRDLKKTCEAMDDILEREYIDPINAKKQQIVSIMTEAFGNIATLNPPSNTRLISSTSTAPNPNVVYMDGITTDFVYSSETVGAGTTPVIGQKGPIYPDILAAFHYPALSNGDHGETDLPLSNGAYIRVSRTIAGSGEYSGSNLGIGQTIYHSGDNDYADATSVVTSQTSLGNFYFFGGTETNNIGANIDVVRAGSSTSISNMITEINDLRSSLRVRIGPPQVNNNAGINTLRSTKLQDELNVWYDEAGNRTTNISDFQGGMDALTGLATSISEYNG
jgi:hypothetical protein